MVWEGRRNGSLYGKNVKGGVRKEIEEKCDGRGSRRKRKSRKEV